MISEKKELSVNEVMLLTSLKRGTIEYFRSALKSKGLMKNNRSMDSKAVECLRAAILYKVTNNCSWVLSVDKAITETYSDKANFDLQAIASKSETKLYEFRKYIEGESVFINPKYVESVEAYSHDASTIIMHSGNRYTVRGVADVICNALLDKIISVQ